MPSKYCSFCNPRKKKKKTFIFTFQICGVRAYVCIMLGWMRGSTGELCCGDKHFRGLFLLLVIVLFGFSFFVILFLFAVYLLVFQHFTFSCLCWLVYFFLPRVPWQTPPRIYKSFHRPLLSYSPAFSLSLHPSHPIAHCLFTSLLFFYCPPGFTPPGPPCPQSLTDACSTHLPNCRSLD